MNLLRAGDKTWFQKVKLSIVSQERESDAK
jgi:hypothetical protein